MAAMENKGNKTKIIALVIVLLVAVGAGVYFVTLNMVKSKGTEQVKLDYYDLGETFINLNDEGGKRYLKTQISLSYDGKNEKLKEEIDKDKPELKDIAIYYFKGKKSEDFNSANESEIKKGLLTEVNKHLTAGQINGVHFQELLIQ
ncbi:flagellar basal body-associated FliL family protein [Clostridium fallax]|uniref:Flagellar protein FliL n=1 Tax=Clostridium fallax TaxID=1533 RepID=A0A1M4UJA5_9CLOT|nr:flagellar basal body-associated FliL family protein [Clostridium fallax]SHE56787.1 Flagellar basal body-associated protein FliL [Clostridium fallax]SQB07595.1 flagellar basal body protein FliL [Clostridium fallax]